MKTNADDSIRPLKPSISGAPRAITPTTKLRGGSEAVRSLHKSPLRDVILPARARSTSRRKQRQWENSNFFGLEAAMLGGNENLSFLFHGETEAGAGVERIDQFPFKVEWKNTMGNLFASKNLSALEAFRSVQNASYKQNFENHSRRKLRCDEWQEGEAAFLQIEKRLRSIISTSCETNSSVIPLLKAMEICIIFSALWRIALPMEHIADDLRACLLSQPIFDDNGNLIISLRDSAFHRLLLHGTCQFYGLKSKSSFVKKTKEKVTVISFPSRLSVALQETLSFAGYLTQSGNERVVDVSLAAQLAEQGVGAEAEAVAASFEVISLADISVNVGPSWTEVETNNETVDSTTNNCGDVAEFSGFVLVEGD